MRKALIFLALLVACVAAHAQTKSDYATLDSIAHQSGMERGLARYRPFAGSPAYRTYTKPTGVPGGLAIYYAKWEATTREWVFEPIEDAIANHVD